MTSATAYLILLFNTLVFCLVITSKVCQQTIPNITLFSVPPTPNIRPKVGTICCAQFRSILHKPYGIIKSSFVSWSLQIIFFSQLPKGINTMHQHDFPVVCYQNDAFLQGSLFISQITCSSPSHPANSFYYPKLKILPPIAQVTMVKLKKNQLGFPIPHLNQPAKSNEILDTFSGK